jgi:hypothetical protein
MFLFINASTRRQSYVSQGRHVITLLNFLLVTLSYPPPPRWVEPWKTLQEFDSAWSDYFTAEHPNEEYFC